MTSTRLIYPDSMPWSEEDEAKYAALSDDFVPFRDERPAGGWAKQTIQIGDWRGIKTHVHLQDNEMVVTKTWDAEPYLRRAKALREQQEGRRWRDGLNQVGVMPEVVMGRMIADGSINDPQAVLRWYRENPAFVANEKYLK